MPELHTAAVPSRLVTRNEFGALCPERTLSAEERTSVASLLGRAIQADLLPESYCTRSKKEIQSRNHHIYDVLLDDGRVTAVVILTLDFWKHLTKLRTRIGKEYNLLKVGADGAVEVIDIDVRTCAKRAKNATELGQLARHYLGLQTVKCITPRVETERGFKVLAKTPEGQLVSAFDGSTYKIGTWRSQAVQDDHGGGFYYYRTEAEASEMTKRGVTFARCVSEGKTLVLCAVEVSGGMVEYDNGKFAASRLRILNEIGRVELDAEE